MESLQKQLDIPREKAREMGIQAVNIINKGFYEPGPGVRIEISGIVEKSVASTITYDPSMHLPVSTKGSFHTTIEVQNTTTLAAVLKLISDGFQPAALNMASATSPGGGFLSGARAQEEYLARSSTLFANLHGNRMYERVDFGTNPFYDDYVIYSPDVLVFRNDDGHLLEDPYTCAFISSPTVMAHAVREYYPERIREIKDVMWKRILKVLAVAHKHEHEVRVLGAWGCGAFGNNGNTIAQLFRLGLKDNFKDVFQKVIFAITDWSVDQRFIGPFQDEFNGFSD